jgi:hypothetical protein
VFAAFGPEPTCVAADGDYDDKIDLRPIALAGYSYRWIRLWREP